MTTTTQADRTAKADRGDVVLVFFPNADLRSARRRPALVVQADNLDTGLSQIIVCTITSRIFRAGHPSRVVVRLSSAEGQQSGLLSDSVAMTDNLATVDDAVVDRVIGALPMPDIDRALGHTLGLSLAPATYTAPPHQG